MVFNKFIYVFLLVITIGMTSNIYAEKHLTNSNINDCSVYLKNPCYGLKGYFEALFLQPTALNTHYYAQADGVTKAGNTVDEIISPNWYIDDVNTKYTFSFIVGMDYFISCRNSSLSLDWQHFNSHDSSSNSVIKDYMVGPFFDIGPDAAVYKIAKGKVKYDLDLVNLAGNFYVQYGRFLQSKMYVGLSFLNFKQELSSEYFSENMKTIRTIESPSKFIGAGPQMGLAFSYDLVKCISMFGKLDTTLFAGSFKNHTEYNSYDPDLQNNLQVSNPNKQSTKVNDRNGFIPAFSSKIGLGYQLQFANRSEVEINAGWQAQVYLDLIQSTDTNSQVLDIEPSVSPVGVYVRTFKRTISNFALMGPFVNLAVSF